MREKKSTAVFLLVVTMFATSITASLPDSFPARPAPVVRSTPCERARTTGVCPAARNSATTYFPTRPVPPATATRMCCLFPPTWFVRYILVTGHAPRL